MKWVTYQGDDGERVGVLRDDTIYAMGSGVTLLDLIARGTEGLRHAGEEAQRSPAATVPAARARLLAPIPRPPSIRDSLCFLDHMLNCQAAPGGSSPTHGIAYRRSTSPVRQWFWARTTMHPPHPEVPGRTSNWRSPR
nr:hypothetical protein [Mycobacterium lepraemurium]